MTDPVAPAAGGPAAASLPALRHACIQYVVENRPSAAVPNSAAAVSVAGGAGSGDSPSAAPVVPSGLYAVVSVWNFLFSTLSGREHDPLTVTRAMQLLKLAPQPPVVPLSASTTHSSSARMSADDTKAQAAAAAADELVSGNQTVMRWFLSLCAAHKVVGTAHYWFKARGLGRTIGFQHWTSEAVQHLHAGVMHTAASPPPLFMATPATASAATSATTAAPPMAPADCTAFVMRVDDEYVVPLASGLLTPQTPLPAALAASLLLPSLQSPSAAVTAGTAAPGLFRSPSPLTSTPGVPLNSTVPVTAIAAARRHSLMSTPNAAESAVASPPSAALRSSRSGQNLAALTAAASASPAVPTATSRAAAAFQTPPTRAAGNGLSRSASANALQAMSAVHTSAAARHSPVALIGLGLTALAVSLPPDTPPLTLPLPATAGHAHPQPHPRLSPSSSFVHPPTLSASPVHTLSPSASAANLQLSAAGGVSSALLRAPSTPCRAVPSSTSPSAQLWVYAFSARLPEQLRAIDARQRALEQRRFQEQLDALLAQQRVEAAAAAAAEAQAQAEADAEAQAEAEADANARDAELAADADQEAAALAMLATSNSAAGAADGDDKQQFGPQPPLQSPTHKALVPPTPPPPPSALTSGLAPSPSPPLPPLEVGPLCAVTSDALALALTTAPYSAMNCILLFGRATDKKPKTGKAGGRLGSGGARRRRAGGRRRGGVAGDDDDSDGLDDDDDDDGAGGGRRRRGSRNGSRKGSRRSSLMRIHEDDSDDDGAGRRRARNRVTAGARERAGLGDEKSGRNDDRDGGDGGGRDDGGHHSRDRAGAGAGSSASGAAGSALRSGTRSPTLPSRSLNLVRHSSLLGPEDDDDEGGAHSAAMSLDAMTRY